MNSEIAILFRRSAIKYSFQKEPSASLPARKNRRSWEKEFRILVARVSEIAILFAIFVIKYSFQKNSLLHCPLKRIIILKKEFPILVARVSEIAILSIRFAIRHYFQKNYLLHCLLKRILVFEKRIPGSCGKSFWNRDSSQDTQMSDALLPPEFSLLFNLLSRTSILLEGVTIKMIILIRILVLKRRICYLGNWECNLIVTRVDHPTLHNVRSRWLEIGLEIALDLWPPGHFKLGDFTSRIWCSEIECSALSFSLE